MMMNLIKINMNNNKLILLLIIIKLIIPTVLNAGLSKTLLYQAPDECKWSGQTDNDIILICNLRTINSELENTNFSVIQPQNTIRLRLECNDQLFFQSSLSSGSFKNLIELRSLQIEYCKLSNLTDGSFRGLNELKNLTIRSHNSDWSSMSMDINDNVFNDLNKLELLDLSKNNIWTIPKNMLCSLKKLLYLNISSNQLQDINNFKFNYQQQHQHEHEQQLNNNNINNHNNICGKQLIELDLSNNKLINLQSSQLSGLINLKKLLLNNNNINFIADRTFEGLIKLNILDLSKNKLHNLPPDLFLNTKLIKEIYLNNNSINVLAPGVFNNLINLEILDLNNNQLNSQWINSNTFMGLKNLIILDISNNKINKLELQIFKNLFNLQILKLNDNLIDIIPDNLFIDLINLHTLILSNNYLLKINQLTLNGLNNIIVLSLDYNNINLINNNSLINCKNLQDFHLNGNKLNKIPDALKFIPLLKTLDLGENLIKNLNNTSLIYLENLYGLRLTDNLIEIINKNFFNKMELLQILNLSKNKIKLIESNSFINNKQIQAIRLDSNLLTTITGLFTKLPNLVWLNISDNLLDTFDYNDIPINLQWLDIHSNHIKQLGNYFEIESELSLSTFDASSNYIKEITTTSIPNSVSMLYLNDNQISKIQPYTFFKKLNLTRVDLIGNNLTTLDPNALRLSPSTIDDKLIPEFYISKNPFKCDCNLDWITNSETRRTQPKLMDLANIQCKLSYNREKMYLPLTETKSSDFHCRYFTHCFALCHCCDFFACDCKMECPHKCKCFHDQSWTSNIVDCSQSGYTNQLPSKIPMDSTQLYLDGNNFKQLNSHTFLGRKRLKILYLNNSNIELIMNRTFYGLLELEILQLNNNNLIQLNGNEFNGLENLNELYLNNNLIKIIDQLTFSNLHSLKLLYLNNNKLIDIKFDYILPPYINKLKLSNNKFECNCDLIENFKIILNKNNIIEDINNITCKNNKNLINKLHNNNNIGIIGIDNTLTTVTLSSTIILNSNNNNNNNNNENNIDNFELIENLILNNTLNCINLDKLNLTNNINNLNNKEFILDGNSTTRLMLSPQTIQNYTVLLGILAACSFIIIFILLIFIFRNEMRIWFHSKFGVRLFYNTNMDIDKNERDKLFDAFISYSSRDEQFIIQELIPLLETGDPHYKLCLYYRDFPPGATLYSDTIFQAIDSSRRTIMILSDNYIKSEWCRFEFKSAHHQILRDRRRKLIVILLGDLPSSKDLDPDLKLYLKTNQYLQWGDKLFWEKLRFALPDVPNNQRRINCNNFQMQQLRQQQNLHPHHHMQQQQQQQQQQCSQQQQQCSQLIHHQSSSSSSPHIRQSQHNIQHQQQQQQQNQHQQQHNLNTASIRQIQPLPPPNNRNINVTNQINLLNSNANNSNSNNNSNNIEISNISNNRNINNINSNNNNNNNSNNSNNSNNNSNPNNNSNTNSSPSTPSPRSMGMHI